MKIKKTTRLIALVLVFGLILSLSGVVTFADGLGSAEIGSGNVGNIGNITETEILTEFPEIIAGRITKNHIQRLNAKEELNTIVYANDDGTETVYMFDTNVKYVDSLGNTQDKNTAIQASTNGFTNQNNDIRVTFPSDVSEGVKLEYAGFSVRLVPASAETEPQTSFGLAKVENVSDGRESRNRVVYDRAFTGARLYYTPTFDGFKEDIILPRYNGLTEYEFVVYTTNATLDGKEIYSNGNKVGEFGEIVIYDAAGNIGYGTTQVTQLSANKYSMVITVDEEFMESATYPVCIDPSITVNTSGSGTTKNIQDAPVYANMAVPAGANGYNFCGYVSSTYGNGVVLVKMPGLILHPSYAEMTADQIQSVKLCFREASGNSGTVGIVAHPFLESWSENTVTKNNVNTANYNDHIDYAAPLYINTAASWWQFNITSIAKAWKNGIFDANNGIILRNTNTTASDKLRNFLATEYTNANYRPYVEFTYTPTISINYSSASIEEGGTQTLVATTNPSIYGVTWSTSNSSIATVSSTGVVNAINPGTVTITASTVDDDGVTHTATCTVYVYIPNGVYYIKNLNSGLYLTVKNGGISNFTDVCQYRKYSNTTSDVYRIRQMWKTCYIGYGRYTIRPMSILSSCLDVTDNNVDIYETNPNDDSSSIAFECRWSIEWSSNGYIIKSRGHSTLTMQVKNSSTVEGETIITAAYNTSLNCKWEMSIIASPPTGAYLFDTINNCVVVGTPEDSKYLIYNSNNYVTELGFVAILYAGSTNNQTFSWSSSNTTVASINSSTGYINALNSGTVSIEATKVINGIEHTVSFNLIVIGEEQYNAGVRIAVINNKQYYDYTIPINSLFDSAVELCADHRCMSWIQYCDWLYDISILSQPNLSTHLGMQLGSLLWFYQQVKTGAVWDVKVQERWVAALPGVPYLKNENKEFGEFVFRGNITTAEGLGNIMYGYVGRATGFGEITLYWGGGVAKVGSVYDESLTIPPLYGDDQNDHDNIKLGFDMFNEDYPNYPDVGYDGIPVEGWLASIADIFF